MPTRTESPWYSHSISSNLIAILLAKNVSTYRDGGKIGHGWRPHRWLPCHDERIFATDDISEPAKHERPQRPDQEPGGEQRDRAEQGRYGVALFEELDRQDRGQTPEDVEVTRR
jgi:hypothetical protein